MPRLDPTSVETVRAAGERIRRFVRETPLERSLRLEELTGVPCWVKLENLQHTGSFKVRGAMNALLSLPRGDLVDGVVAASTGNHGAGTAFAAGTVGTRATVFVPENASPTKLGAIRRLGAEIRLHGLDGIEAEEEARRFAEQTGRHYLSPYNDPAVIAGQGTVGVELARQLEAFDSVFVAVGGGGLVSGLAGYLAELRPQVRVVGCSPKSSAVMAESVRAGRMLELASGPTLSDGTAGGVETDTITFEPCRRLVDDWVLVDEGAIRSAMLEFMEAHHLMIEGAAGVALAAFLERAERIGGERAVVVVCGGNIALDTLRDLLGRGGGAGRLSGDPTDPVAGAERETPDPGPSRS
jgi:threonine dehydratase